MTMKVKWAKRILSLSDIDTAKNQGFDIAQLPVSTIMNLEDDAFLREKTRLLTSGISFEVFESPLPDGVVATERGFNTYSWIEYLKKAISRIASLGCTTLVWNDAKSRILPEEGEVSILKENFNQFLFMLAEFAEKSGIKVCLEPFGKRRTNFLNSLREVAGVIQSIGKDNLAMTISAIDIAETETSLEELILFRNLILHMYADSPEKNLDYFKMLQNMEFEGIIALPKSADAELLRSYKAALAAE